ncbi:hypothetical protein GE061_007964 [Apolygus lucorum]|uniref:Uncharacterized protein n=1 Tax=Apolygus lucorum TaxID=248454 RepID=A0A8S9WNF3_APOLU|nr:hypothetical protein GE061_007964 [Apolygus lucorum]
MVNNNDYQGSESSIDAANLAGNRPSPSAMVRALIVFGAVMASFVGFGSTAIRHQLRDRKIFRMRYNSFDDPPGPRGNNVTQQLVTTSER